MVQYRLLAVGAIWGSVSSTLLAAHKTIPAVAILLGLPALAFFGHPKKAILSHRAFWMAAIIGLLSSAIQLHRIYSLPITPEKHTAKVSGTVVFVSRKSDGSKRVLLKLHAIDGRQLWSPWPLYASLFSYHRGSPLNAGTTGLFTVRWRRPEVKENPHAPDVWSVAYSRRIVAWGTMIAFDVGENIGWWHRVRAWVGEKLSHNFSSLTSGFLRAILLGERNHIPEPQKTALSHAGLGHLLAISGLHVAAISIFGIFSSWILMAVCACFGRPRQLVGYLCAIPLVWVYVAIAGFPISGVRAAGMLTVFALLRAVSVHTELRDMLLIVLALVVVVDPVSIFSPSLWASYGAVTLIEMALRSASSHHRLLQLLRIQVYLTVGLLPLMVGLSGGWAPMGVILNLVVVPIFSFLFFPLLATGFLLQALCDWKFGLNAIDTLVQGLFDVGSWATKTSYIPMQFDSGLQILCLLSAFMLLSAKPFAKRSMGVGGVVLVACLWWFGPEIRPWSARLWLLDTGQSMSVVWEHHRSLLVYDVARNFNYAYGLVTSAGYRDRWLVVSHDDIDHSGGLHVPFDWRWFKYRLSGQPDALARRYGITFQGCDSGAHFVLENVQVDILWPDNSVQIKEDNDYSCVLQLTYAGSRVLLTGDITAVVEHALLKERRLKPIDVLVVPHHGSKYSSTSAFLEKIRPDWSLIAASPNNPWGLPRPETLERLQAVGSRIFWTGADGPILCEWDDVGHFSGCVRWRDRSSSSS